MKKLPKSKVKSSKGPQISNINAGFMIATALIFDAVQVLLTISVFLIPLSWLVTGLSITIFGVWFAVLGVNYMSGRKAGIKMLSALTATVGELVPVINALPAFTAGVVMIIISTRLEDKGT